MGQLGWTQPEPKGLQIGGFWATDPDPDAGLGGKGERQTDGADGRSCTSSPGCVSPAPVTSDDDDDDDVPGDGTGTSIRGSVAGMFDETRC